MTTRREFLGSTLPLAGGALAYSMAAPPAQSAEAPSDEPPQPVPLTPGEEGTLTFETSAMTGVIQPRGAYHGVTRLTDKKTGRQWIDERYSALNLFKLQSVNHYMGQPREMPSVVTPSETAVEVRWAPTEMHRGEIVATYQVYEPNIVDVTVTVHIDGTYPGYEVFMSNYFDKATRSHLYLKQRFAGTEPELVAPSVNDAFRNLLLVFPRDANVAGYCLDGRWDRSEGDVPVVQNCPARHYAHCLAFLADPERQSAVVLMSTPRDAYGISTRYHADREEDRQTSYSAVDFSLCGDNVVAGDQRTLRVRLALTDLDQEMSQPLALYKAFVDQATA